MNNYRKLLFAGLAIVPMALSSWTSNGQNANYENGDGAKYSSIEIIGDTAASSVVTTKTKKNIFSKETVETVDKVESKVAISAFDKTLSFDKIVNDYK
ncbi:MULTISPECIES: hypothetical protein [unclassified Chryseobacterium]|uniref:hypothetical protein n=1 Tax=unclassified Chryseobacterium TaxID=2593645 RepID=UPI00226AAE4E|nr:MULTISPECIES: hypothetical protein [unclassified Chryseobacterium]